MISSIFAPHMLALICFHPRCNAIDTIHTLLLYLLYLLFLIFIILCLLCLPILFFTSNGTTLPPYDTVYTVVLPTILVVGIEYQGFCYLILAKLLLAKGYNYRLQVLMGLLERQVVQVIQVFLALGALPLMLKGQEYQTSGDMLKGCILLPSLYSCYTFLG